MPQLDIEELSQHFETASPSEILGWAWETFGPDVAAISSFQTQSVPLLHLISQVTPQLPILFLDTGFHFTETLMYRDRLTQDLGLKVQVLTPEMGHDGFKRQHSDLFRRNPDLCCYINKVEPLRRAMQGLKAWISGIRRDQTPQRRHTPIIAKQANGLYKICPLATWTRRDVWQYLHDHNLPEHPLLAQGYLSIGCAPCTQPVDAGQDERAGRWNGQDKTECGLHIDLNPEVGNG
jgi:phosphoadenosine phosphosulfate reductase